MGRRCEVIEIPKTFARKWFKYFIGGKLPAADRWYFWIDTPPEDARHIYSISNGDVLHGIAGW